MLTQRLLRPVGWQHHKVGADLSDEVRAMLGLDLPGPPQQGRVAAEQFRVGGELVDGNLDDLPPSGLGERSGNAR